MNVLNGDTVAQLAHVGFGGLLSFILARYMKAWKAVALVIVFAAIKEGSEALGIAFWEPKQPWGSSAIDFAFFGVGIGVYLLFSHLKSKYGNKATN